MKKRKLIRKLAMPAVIIAAISLTGLIVMIPINNSRYDNHKEDFKKYIGEEISIREASRKTGIPSQTISRWIHSNKLTSREEGQYILVSLDQIMYAAALYNYVKALRGSTWGIDIFAV